MTTPFPFDLGVASASQAYAGGESQEVGSHVMRARELVREIAMSGSQLHIRAVLDLAEQAYHTAGRLNQLLMALTEWAAGMGDQAARSCANEVHMLGSILVRLSTEAQTVQKISGSTLMELDAILDRLSQLLHSGDGYMFVGTSTANLGSGRVDDLVKQASVFAQDVAALARQTLSVTQDMRSSLSQFRPEVVDHGNTTAVTRTAGNRDPLA